MESSPLQSWRWTLIAIDGMPDCNIHKLTSKLCWKTHVVGAFQTLSISHPSHWSYPHFAFQVDTRFREGESRGEMRRGKNSFPHFSHTIFPPFFLFLEWCLKAWLIFRRNSPRVIQYFDKLNEMMHGCHERKRRRKQEWMWKIWISHPFLFFHPPLIIIITEAALRVTESMQNIDHSTFHRQTQARQDWIFDRFPMDTMDGGVKWTSKKKFIWIDNE